MVQEFNATFFGTGGSTATNSGLRNKYGNNTSCVFVHVGGHLLLLDLGTGGVQAMSTLQQHPNLPIHILFSHFHYDHIEGLPYFTPLYEGRDCRLYGEKRGQQGIEDILGEYFKMPFAPTTLNTFSSAVTYHNFEENEILYLEGGVKIETFHIHHVGITTGYKISYNGKSLVYLLDHEHGSHQDEKIFDHCCGADVVIYDAHFTPSEYNGGKYVGWGHSTYEAGCRLAEKAKIGRLVLSHHALWRTDTELDEMEKKAKTLFSRAMIAAEGMEITI